MANNISPIFPLTPLIGIATLTAATAITSRANITGTTGLTQLTAANATQPARIDQIVMKGKGVTVASIVGLWLYNGTTSFLFDEIDVAAVTASTTVDSILASKSYTTLVIPINYQLFISETVQTDLNVFAFGGAY